MKVYIIKEADLQSLRDKLKTDPRFGPPNSGVASDAEKYKYQEMHRFYNYHVECWITEITKDA